jgi:hypothetical protein
MEKLRFGWDASQLRLLFSTPASPTPAQPRCRWQAWASWLPAHKQTGYPHGPWQLQKKQDPSSVKDDRL